MRNRDDPRLPVWIHDGDDSHFYTLGISKLMRQKALSDDFDARVKAGDEDAIRTGRKVEWTIAVVFAVLWFAGLVVSAIGDAS